MKPELEKYFADIPSGRREMVGLPHRTVLECFPGAIVDVSYRMPTYRARDGWVAIANQKQDVSLYTCGAHHLERFKADYPKIKTGKGCINCRSKEPIPLVGVKQVVRHAMSQPKDRAADG